MTLDSAWDLVDEGFDNSEIVRTPDDLEFRRVLLMLKEKDSNLTVEGAIAAWHQRQRDPRKAHRQLIGHVVYRMEMLCSAKDTTHDTFDFIEELSEINEEGKLPFHKTFMSSSCPYVGSQTVKTQTLVGKRSRLLPTMQVEVFRNIAARAQALGTEEPLAVKVCEEIRDVTVFFEHLLVCVERSLPNVEDS